MIGFREEIKKRESLKYVKLMTRGQRWTIRASTWSQWRAICV
jgi:hypothetical protein